MALTKSQRIQILLAIDGVFFFLELITGYAVHSLALVADSFHMLNDVFSLIIALWAVKAASRESNTTYTYGWQRAETLGALVNGVFLVALCATIFIEAIQRFVQIEEVSNPMVILIVGCCGLASNICGLFLFHDHSHGPGGHSHGHGHDHGHAHGEPGHKHSDEISAAEEGCGNGHMRDSTSEMADESGNPVAALPQVQTGAWSTTKTPATQRVRIQEPEDNKHDGHGAASNTGRATSSPHHHRSHSAGSRNRSYSGVENIPGHPASFRQSIIMDSQRNPHESEPTTEDESEDVAMSDTLVADETTPLVNSGNGIDNGKKRKRSSSTHKHHKHTQPKEPGEQGGHGHSHSDLNMRGVFLHVLGDALGNVGVIVTALFIWKTKFWWRYYCDPLVSLVITVIILCSAIPLCKAAARILLQGVPAGVDVNHIKDDICSIDGILRCHDVHVWQLSDTKLIASLHVDLTFELEGAGRKRYMEIAEDIQECLHAYGIHHSTIQPEFGSVREANKCKLSCKTGCDDAGTACGD